ncbi:MAG: 30S ribosomal protein S1 [Candidatus Omnitrophica bacterium]|nr:30S ribosomal protein S1 [Candidatus Omnitrophota bacterium]
MVAKEKKEQGGNPERPDGVPSESEGRDKNEMEMSRIYEDSIAHFEEGQIVKGKIIHLTPKEVVVDIGYKSEGIISMDEFRSAKDIKVGDEIDVLLESKENEDGIVVLSKEKVERARGWDRIVKGFKEGDAIEGKILKKVRGGFMVDVGIEAFLPASQAVFRESEATQQLLEFKILKINKIRKNVVLSRKAALFGKREEEKKKLFSSIEKGMRIKGVVKNITDFGAFIDVGGGIIGLLHIADMSWGRVNHPSEIVAVGDEIEVVILDFKKDEMRISLGIRQKTKDPWEDVETKYPVGNKITGKVVNIAPYGAFVELEKGIEGLVHISEFSWTKKYGSPNELLAIGDRVPIMVLDIKKEARKISLGIKQLEQDPWQGIEDRFKVGDKIKGKVRHITDYGAFVQLEEGIDGLVHVSDLSWTKKIAHPGDILKKGDKAETVILSVDGLNRRIALGVKQLLPDPWDDIQAKYASGTVIKGKIVKITNFGMFVEMEKDLEGLLHISEAGLGPDQNLEEKFKVGDELEVKILRVDGVQKKIALSIKA